MTRPEPNPEQLTIQGVNPELLNQTLGVVVVRPRDVGLTLAKRSNITGLATRMGHWLGPRLEQSPVTDSQLDVYEQNFDQADIESIESGLYFPNGDPRKRFAQQLIVVGQRPVYYSAPGVVPRHTGVVFPEQEFKIVARNAKDLVKHTIAKTRLANIDNHNREDLQGITFRSAAHVMETKMESMDGLRDDIVDDQHVLLRIVRDTKSTWRTHYKAKNLDRDRRHVDELIHETAEISSLIYNLGTVATNAMHRAITSKLYRSLTADDIARSWMSYAQMVGRYNNARLGKIFQSKSDCYGQYVIYEPYLKTRGIDKSTSV